MNDGKRYLFYDVLSGEILVNEARNRLNIMPTVERVIDIYPKLNERDSSTYDVLILNFEDYQQDFKESNGYRINPQTLELEFSYPDPNEPEAPQEFIKPLSVEVERLKEEDLNNKEAIAELYLMTLGGF